MLPVLKAVSTELTDEMLTQQAGGTVGGPGPASCPPQSTAGLCHPQVGRRLGAGGNSSPSSSRTSQAEPRPLGKGVHVSLSRDFLCSQESRSGLSRCTDVKSKFKITCRRSSLRPSTSGQVGPSASYPSYILSQHPAGSCRTERGYTPPVPPCVLSPVYCVGEETGSPDAAGLLGLPVLGCSLPLANPVVLSLPSYLLPPQTAQSPLQLSSCTWTGLTQFMRVLALKCKD